MAQSNSYVAQDKAEPEFTEIRTEYLRELQQDTAWLTFIRQVHPGKLNFDDIEGCFPEDRMGEVIENEVYFNAQWLHDFAHAIEEVVLEKLCKNGPDVYVSHTEHATHVFFPKYEGKPVLSSPYMAHWMAGWDTYYKIGSGTSDE
jgi:hypothetical protein